MDEKHPAHNLFYSVQDPQAPIQNCPAMTTMMFKVCDRDHTKFDEAMRLVGLFMAAAYEQGKTDALKPDPDACPYCGSKSIRCGCD